MLIYAFGNAPRRIDSKRTIVLSVRESDCELQELENGRVTGIVYGKDTSDEEVERLIENARHFLLPHTPHPFAGCHHDSAPGGSVSTT